MNAIILGSLTLKYPSVFNFSKQNLSIRAEPTSYGHFQSNFLWLLSPRNWWTPFLTTLAVTVSCDRINSYSLPALWHVSTAVYSQRTLSTDISYQPQIPWVLDLENHISFFDRPSGSTCSSWLYSIFLIPHQTEERRALCLLFFS